MDEVSSYGYAWGYIGSCIPFLIALIGYILGPDMVGLISNRMSMIIGYTVTAIWWLQNHPGREVRRVFWYL
ncbi:MAG: hypothetical protein SO172_06300 [Pararoseburia sp.]|nr:hypothetical protein [Pararoseburia sp.]